MKAENKTHLQNVCWTENTLHLEYKKQLSK